MSPNAPNTTPKTAVTFAESLRFVEPPTLEFDVPWSQRSIQSLLLMAGVSMVILVRLLATDMPPWVWAPFAFTIFGSGLGMLFEVFLLVTGVPFQQSLTPGTRWIRRIRLLNLGPVTATIFYFAVCMVVADVTTRFVLFCVAAALGSGLAFALFFGGAEIPIGLVLLAMQVVQMLMVLCFGVRAGDGWAAFLLVAQAVAQLTALRIGTRDPQRSTSFHVVSTISGALLFGALLAAVHADPDFPARVAAESRAYPFGTLTFLVACGLGVVLTTKLFPMVYAHWRTSASNTLWSSVYFLLVSEKTFPSPIPLDDVYKNVPPKPITLRPYYLAHPEHLVDNLSIPAAEDLGRSVMVFGDLLARIKKVFALLARLDNAFPQADIRVPLERKPRVETWSDGQAYWPRVFLKTIVGRSIPGQALDPAPAPAIAAYQEGQFLAYLCEVGIGSTFLDFAPERGADARVVDFRFLELYQTKLDYESYGGIAYFRLNDQKARLELVGVVPPRSTEEIAVNPADPAFRHAEAMVVASLYFQVISGKHLAEIHMTYNLVNVAIHNAFDVAGEWNHPIRVMLYPHFFSHALAEELTTEHLVQERAVFTQVFATTHSGLIRHLNDCYHAFRLGSDEDFDRRVALLTTSGAAGATPRLLPNAAIAWELRYVELWKRYTWDVVTALYDSDAAVCADPALERLDAELRAVLLNGLPPRYDHLRTREGITRFVVDTIHHCVIRHEVYGTSGVRAALDPRIAQTQVPRDGGAPGVDEWRAVACVGLATSRARFTPLLADYRYLLKGVAPAVAPRMETAFTDLQTGLKQLDAEWTNTAADCSHNYDYFRVVPSELDTGPGY